MQSTDISTLTSIVALSTILATLLWLVIADQIAHRKALAKFPQPSVAELHAELQAIDELRAEAQVLCRDLNPDDWRRHEFVVAQLDYALVQGILRSNYGCRFAFAAAKTCERHFLDLRSAFIG